MVALCRRIAHVVASGSVAVDSCGRNIIASLCNLAFSIGERRRPSGAWSSTVSKEVGWELIINYPVVAAYRSGLIGWVV